MPLSKVQFEHKGVERIMTPQELLDFARTRPDGFPYTYEVLSVILGYQQDRGEHLSTTALLGECDRQMVLERLVPYTDRIESLWAAFTGTMFHEQLEKAHIPGQTVVERRYWMEYPGLGWLSCKPDLIDVLFGLMEDYKSKKELPKYDYPYKKDANQLQVNRFIVDHAQYIECEAGEAPVTSIHPPGAPPQGVPVRHVATDERPEEWNELAVVYLAPRDGMKRMVLTESIEVPKKTGPGTKKKRVPVIWSDEAVEEFIEERYAVKRDALDAYKTKMKLPPIPKEFMGWTGFPCDWCAVRRQCVQKFKKGR